METLLLGLVLFWSLYTLLAKLVPRPLAALRGRAAAWATAQGAPRLAAWLLPRALPVVSCGGCDHCSGRRCNTPAATMSPPPTSSPPAELRIPLRSLH